MALLLNTNDKCQMGIISTQYLPTPLMANERLTPTSREVKWKVLMLTGNENWARWGTRTYGIFIRLNDLYKDNVSNIRAYSTHFASNYSSWSSKGKAEIMCNNQDMILTFSDDISVEDAVAWLKSEYDAGHPVTVWYQLANPTTEPVETTPIGTLRNEEKTIKGTTTIITTDTEVLPTQIEASYKSNKVDYVVVNYATADGNIFTTANGDTYTIKMRKSQYDTMMTNELLSLLEVM